MTSTPPSSLHSTIVIFDHLEAWSLFQPIPGRLGIVCRRANSCSSDHSIATTLGQSPLSLISLLIDRAESSATLAYNHVRYSFFNALIEACSKFIMLIPIPLSSCSTAVKTDYQSFAHPAFPGLCTGKIESTISPPLTARIERRVSLSYKY